MLGIALAAGSVIVAVLLLLLGIPRSGSGWIWTVGLGLVGAWIAWVVLSIGQRSSEALAAGTADADAARGDRFEATGRRAGKVVGGGIARVTGRSNVEPESEAHTSGDSDQRSNGSTSGERPSLDDTARMLGQMVGRRLGPKRKDQ